MITISELSVSYDSKKILNIANAQFQEGTVHGIIGLNGAGKTTFFNTLSCFLKPQTGLIERQGHAIAKNDIGFLETSNYFYAGLTAREYLQIFPATNTRFNLQAVNTLLQLPLDEVIEGYSTGMKKKLALLAIICQEKEVYIFDEPFNGLDLESNRAVELIIGTLKSRGKTVFLSSHILSPLVTVCDEIHLLEQGSFKKSYLPPQFDLIEEELFSTFNVQAADILGNAI